jgi:hypothetical protein
MENLPKDRYNQWREDNPDEMLHLDDKTRLRMGRACIEYFKALYGITPCDAPNKPAGLLLKASTNQRQKRLATRQFKPKNILYSMSAKERKHVLDNRSSRARQPAETITCPAKDSAEHSSNIEPKTSTVQKVNSPKSDNHDEQSSNDLKVVVHKMLAFIGKNKIK